MSIIDVCSLKLAFGERVILDGFDIRIEAGETVALVGRSGAGKTTLLRTMAGLRDPTAGTVKIDGKGPKLLLGSGEIRYLHQIPTLWRHLTVTGNMKLGFRLLGIKPAKNEIENRMKEVGLWRHTDKYPHELSQGESARLALARAFIGEPKVVFVDEPFASLDPIRREDLNNRFRTLQKKNDSTIVMVTHDVVEAMRFSDRIVVISREPMRVEVQHVPQSVDPNMLGPEHIRLREEIFAVMRHST